MYRKPNYTDYNKFHLHIIEPLHLTSLAVKQTIRLETQVAWNLPSTTLSTVAVAQLPYKLIEQLGDDLE